MAYETIKNCNLDRRRTKSDKGKIGDTIVFVCVLRREVCHQCAEYIMELLCHNAIIVQG